MTLLVSVDTRRFREKERNWSLRRCRKRPLHGADITAKVSETWPLQHRPKLQDATVRNSFACWLTDNPLAPRARARAHDFAAWRRCEREEPVRRQLLELPPLPVASTLNLPGVSGVHALFRARGGSV
jgi:hypothetical protein